MSAVDFPVNLPAVNSGQPGQFEHKPPQVELRFVAREEPPCAVAGRLLFAGHDGTPQPLVSRRAFGDRRRAVQLIGQHVRARDPSDAPCPASNDTAYAASPTSVTRPLLHVAISIRATWS